MNFKLYCFNFEKMCVAMIKIEQLYYLKQIAKYGSFTYAAESLFITQPALSKSVRLLENELGGLRLLNRSVNGVSLTSDGLDILQIAEPIFSAITQLEQYVLKKIFTPIENVRLYYTPNFRNAFISKLIVALHHVQSEIDITLFPICAQTIEEIETIIEKDNEAIVFAIIPEIYQVQSTVVKYAVLDKSKVYLCIRNDDKILPLDVKTISLKKLASIPLISFQAKNENIQKVMFELLYKFGGANIVFNAEDATEPDLLLQEGVGGYLCVDINGIAKPYGEYKRVVNISQSPTFYAVLLYHRDIFTGKIDSLLELIKAYIYS